MMKGLDGNTTRNASYAILLIFAATTVGLFLQDIPIGNKETLNHVISTLENVLLIVAGFLFGSSIGSRNKDKQVEPVTEEPKP